MKDMYVIATRRAIVGSALVGALTGALTWVFNLLLQRFFIDPVFCRSADNFSICANGGTYAFNSALIILSIIAVVALVRVGGYRPLLVVIAAVATLWSANTWLGVNSWWEATLWMSFLSMLTYLVHSWLARIINFPISVLLMAIIVITARIIVVRS